MFVNAAIAVTFVTTSGAIKHCLLKTTRYEQRKKKKPA